MERPAFRRLAQPSKIGQLSERCGLSFRYRAAYVASHSALFWDFVLVFQFIRQSEAAFLYPFPDYAQCSGNCDCLGLRNGFCVVFRDVP